MYPAGQAISEFLVTLAITTLVVIGSFSILARQWLKLNCLNETFQATHARLVGRPEATQFLPARFRRHLAHYTVREDIHAWVGTGNCRWGRLSVSETVELQKWGQSR